MLTGDNHDKTGLLERNFCKAFPFRPGTEPRTLENQPKMDGIFH